MKKNIVLLALFANLIIYAPIYTLSIVYSFRIAQITRQQIIQETQQKPNALSTVIFDLFQKNHTFDIRENYAGGMLTYNLNFLKKYYLRTDFAVAHTNQTIKKVPNVDATESDDILFTLGRNFQVTEKSRITLSGLFGIPTHSVNNLQRVGFGLGQVGLGAQIDGLYKIDRTIDFLWGARYNYFIPRTAFNAQEKAYKFSVGSIADLLVGLQTSNQLSHGLEGGYAARWGFGISAFPIIPKIDDLNYMRNNFYFVYKYGFLTKDAAHRLLLNISYGFDAKPKLYGYKAITILMGWGIAF